MTERIMEVIFELKKILMILTRKFDEIKNSLDQKGENNG